MEVHNWKRLVSLLWASLQVASWPDRAKPLRHVESVPAAIESLEQLLEWLPDDSEEHRATRLCHQLLTGKTQDETEFLEVCRQLTGT